MSNVLKAAAGLNALAVVGHGVMGLVDLFPVLDASPPSKMRTAAKIGWMEGCGYFALSCKSLGRSVENRGGRRTLGCTLGV
jgi:hypothetical protein